MSPPPEQGAGTALEALLRERIRERGPISFRDYMDACLYHPELGYYASGAVRTGRRGHFLTSPEVDPAFGALWSRAFEGLWEACGSPSQFTVVELGPGEGGFAVALLSAAAGSFAEALGYILVEPHPAVAARQRARLSGGRVQWKAELSEVAPLPAGVVFGNEVLDNLPVHVIERRGGDLYEVHVTITAAGLEEVLLPPSLPELSERGDWLAEGQRSEVGIESEALVREAGGVVERGAVALVDYGTRDGRARTRGTVVAYSGAAADTSVLERPGERDITAHVDWEAAATSLRGAGLEVEPPVPQRDTLLALGISELDGQLRVEHDEAVATGAGAAAVRALSRRQALRALLDPGGLGGLQVLVATKSVAWPVRAATEGSADDAHRQKARRDHPPSSRLTPSAAARRRGPNPAQ